MTPRFASLLIAATLGLSGCAGFQPMHAAPGLQTAFDNMSVEIGEGNDETDRAVGFFIRQRMADRIGDLDGAPGTDPYHLEIRPSFTRVGLGLTAEDRATRFDSLIRARWTLRDTETGRLVGRGESRSTSSYSASFDPYELLSTTDEANRRAARDVVDEILDDVSRALGDAETSAG